MSWLAKERIAQFHLKKRPRSDAIGIEDIIVSASVDFMLQLDCDTREQYFRNSLYFFQRRYGKENSCIANVIWTNPPLEQLQNDFHREVSQHYGLERGEHHAKKISAITAIQSSASKNQSSTLHR